MVAQYDADSHIVLDIAGGSPLRVYLFTKIIGATKINIKRRRALELVVLAMHKDGKSVDEIADALEIPKRLARRIVSTGKVRYRSVALAALLAGSPHALYERADDSIFSVRVTGGMGERIMIRELLKAGWSVRQIAAALGVNKRRVYRLKEKIKEDADGGY